MGLKHRGNLRDLYLAPAIFDGYINRLYPDAVSRTDQAYYLTPKGLELLKKLTENKKPTHNRPLGGKGMSGMIKW